MNYFFQVCHICCAYPRLRITQCVSAKTEGNTVAKIERLTVVYLQVFVYVYVLRMCVYIYIKCTHTRVHRFVLAPALNGTINCLSCLVVCIPRNHLSRNSCHKTVPRIQNHQSPINALVAICIPAEATEIWVPTAVAGVGLSKRALEKFNTDVYAYVYREIQRQRTDAKISAKHQTHLRGVMVGII